MPIREATGDDAETLAHLGAETFKETFGHLYKEEDLASFLASDHSPEAYGRLLANPSFALWIAETDDGAAVGYAVAGACSLPAPGSPKNAGELKRLYLLADAQGAGLGKALLAAALAWLRPRFDKIYLSVYADNPRAQRLYNDFGFVKIHEYFYLVGSHRDPEWIMELKD